MPEKEAFFRYQFAAEKPKARFAERSKFRPKVISEVGFMQMRF